MSSAKGCAVDLKQHLPENEFTLDELVVRAVDITNCDIKSGDEARA